MYAWAIGRQMLNFHHIRLCSQSLTRGKSAMPRAGKKSASSNNSLTAFQDPDVVSTYEPSDFFNVEDKDSGSSGLLKISGDGKVEIDELLEMLDLIEMWLVAKRPDIALKFLAPFVNLERVSSPIPWIALLEVYVALNDCSSYEMVAERILKWFNVEVPSWHDRAKWTELASLGDVQHVREKLANLWETEEIGPYLDSLINDERGGRSGFAIGIFKDLARLHRIAKKLAQGELDDVNAAKDADSILYADAKPAIPSAVLSSAVARFEIKEGATNTVYTKTGRGAVSRISASHETAITKELLSSFADDLDLKQGFCLNQKQVPSSVFGRNVRL
ncbi:hypothetical protein [Noviherbaspirillum galbum]|uniref:Uncharacterized protein n=1 Tax=Noviherbaspirillum galbum TaxID=2709383 RepID=A0A6B3SGU0_9BURK|nr:hypothetical protein [Noviherbaspirillum galbum]NEX60084.1 hypothetical protein [Noviherbaspirillum galbum]